MKKKRKSKGLGTPILIHVKNAREAFFQTAATARRVLEHLNKKPLHDDDCRRSEEQIRQMELLIGGGQAETANAPRNMLHKDEDWLPALRETLGPINAARDLFNYRCKIVKRRPALGGHRR